jgi:hypothetical protein
LANACSSCWFTNTFETRDCLMLGTTVFRLYPRRFDDESLTRGLSCDEEGVFLAGQTPLVARTIDDKGRQVYSARHVSEINFALSAGYGVQVDFDSRMSLLRQIARHMTEGDWTAARIAALHLRMPEIPDESAMARLAKAEILLRSELVPSPQRTVSRPEPGSDKSLAQRRMKDSDEIFEAISECSCRPAGTHWEESRKRDVSSEPRIPRGQPGGGQWTSDAGTSGGTNPRPSHDALTIPVQAIEAPLPWVPFLRPMPPIEIPRAPIEPVVPRPQFPAPPSEIPGPPTEVTPSPPNLPPTESLRPGPPLKNPFPRSPKCVEEWDHAHEFCRDLEDQGLLGKGKYKWMGRTYSQCVLGQVSAECGGNQLRAYWGPESRLRRGNMRKVTSEELLEQHGLLRTEPQRFLALVDQLIQQDPSNPHPYFSRHNAWMRLGRPDLALRDLDTSLRLKSRHGAFEARGNVLRALGRHEEAIKDFDRSEAMDPERWADGFGSLFRAECHARLGNEQAALADCRRLRDDHWTPGLLGAPAGNKSEVIAEIRRLAAAAARARR